MALIYCCTCLLLLFFTIGKRRANRSLKANTEETFLKRQHLQYNDIGTVWKRLNQ